MAFQVRAIYDFQAQPGSGELSISNGDVLTVTRQDVGDGWWEGRNTRGESGLFPEGYVEPFTTGTSRDPVTPTQETDDAWDDEWDDDDDSQTSTNAGDGFTFTGPLNSTSGSVVPQKVAPKKGSGLKSTGLTNRFSTFVKSGGEEYILGNKNKSVPEDSKVYVTEDGGRYRWLDNQHPYTCQLASPKKETKLKGLKSFIAYQLTPSFNSIQVSRRYKHFDWLQARLEEKFITIPIPPLPDKQISGRYQEDFIRHRLAQLQLWVNRICRHPVLSQSEVWMHFVTCTDEKRWKDGKRRAENDDFRGANFFFAIQPPGNSLEVEAVDRKTDHFSRFTVRMDDAVKHLYSMTLDQSKKFRGPYKREFTRVSASFNQLAEAFAGSGFSHEDRSLNEAIRHTSTTYDAIGNLYEEQPLHDFEPLSDALYEYKGLLSNWPDILQVHKGALNKKREHFKLRNEGKVDSSATQSVFRRADIVSFATMAEIEYFQTERVADFRDMMKSFISEQITFYKRIVDTLESNLQRYERP